MKQSVRIPFKKLSLAALSSFSAVISFAQDSASSSSSSTAVTSKSSSVNPGIMWYMQPWAWVVGALILITIIFLAMGGGKNKRHRTADGKVEDDFAVLPDRDTI